MAAEPAPATVKPPSRLREALSVLSNGFVLLLVGSIITSFLVPKFQRQYEAHKQQIALMQECLTQFLLYSNSVMQEYYAIVPLTQETDMGREQYTAMLKTMTEIKLRRYDAYAKVKALASTYGAQRGDDSARTVASELDAYAVRVNQVSAEMDAWLRNLYCTPTKRTSSPCASFDPRFDAFGEFERIKGQVVDVANSGADRVGALMVSQMNAR